MAIPLGVIYPAMKLPVPIILWWHNSTQRKKAKHVGKLDQNAPVLLPIYSTVIIMYLIYVIVMVLNRVLDMNGLTQKTWQELEASSFSHAMLLFFLGEGTFIFSLFFVFSFLAAPTAGKYALRHALADACKFTGVYGVMYVVGVTSPIERSVYFQLKIASAAIVIYFFFTLLVQFVKTSPHQGWKSSLYYTMISVLLAWVAWCILLLSAIMYKEHPLFLSYMSHLLLVFYDFVLPFLVYKCLIDDSRFWRNLEKHLIPTKSFSLNSSLLENDGLKPITGSGKFGVLKDTLVNLDIPLIDFTLLESKHSILGIGGNGVVWKGEYRGDPVAVKETRRDRISIETVQEFLREALLSTKFEHPNILKFHGVCVAPPQFLMIFEWCNHNELGEYLIDNQLSPMQRLDLALQSVMGLEFFHKKGLVHRDIKPQNYLVHQEESGQLLVKLADFGSSRSQYDAMPLLKGISPIFAPPEIVKHLPEDGSMLDEDRVVKYGPEVDIYSCGWVLWAILYKGNWKTRMKEKYQDMATGWKPDLSKYDPILQEILNECWADDPSARPTIAMLHSLLLAVPPPQPKSIGDASVSAHRSLSSAFEISSISERQEQVWGLI